jgi:uncharacterized phage-like protein YoqJ
MKYIIFFVQGGIGKHIAATAVAENIKKNYPDRNLVVLCSYPEVFLNNPFVYRVYKANISQYFYEDFFKNKDTIFLGDDPYLSTEYIVEKKHLIESWCNSFNLKYDQENPRLFLNQAELLKCFQKFKTDKPLLLIHTNGGNDNNPYNWSRDLPEFSVIDIIQQLKEKYQILHIAREDQVSFADTRKVYGDLRELFGLINLSEKRLFIDSFPQHAAAAMLKPSVVCWVATSPDKLGYNIHKNILPNEEAKIFSHNLDSILLEKEFVGVPHQCNFDISKMFSEKDILEKLIN